MSKIKYMQAFLKEYSVISEECSQLFRQLHFIKSHKTGVPVIIGINLEVSEKLDKQFVIDNIKDLITDKKLNLSLTEFNRDRRLFELKLKK